MNKRDLTYSKNNLIAEAERNFSWKIEEMLYFNIMMARDLYLIKMLQEKNWLKKLQVKRIQM